MVAEKFTPNPESDRFESAICAVRRESINDDLVRRVEQKAIALANEPQTAVQPAKDEATRSVLSHPMTRRIAWTGVLAASLLLAFSFLGRSGSGKAWAEVVQAVAKEKWMRLSLQFPDDMPEDIVDPEFKIWISGDRTTVATDGVDECRWDNLATDETWHFNRKTGRLRLGKIEVEDRAEMQFYVQLLDQLRTSKLRRGRIRGELIKSDRENVVVDGKQFIDFRFVFRYENVFAPKLPSKTQTQPLIEEMTVRVDGETKRPVELISKREGIEGPPRVLVIDYPEVGPEDVYALNVPHDAPVDDVQSLARFFPAKKPKNVADYEMIQMEFAIGDTGPFLNWAYRYRKQGDTLTRELADWKKVQELAFAAHRKGRGLPTNETELRWFTDKIRGYDFETQDDTDYPHTKCYPALGRVVDYDSTNSSRTKGLEECLVIRGPKRSVWFDPTRDMIVRRLEFVKKDQKNVATEVQDVIQGPNGNWFATRFGGAEVDEPGGELTLGSQFICDYKFEE